MSIKKKIVFAGVALTLFSTAAASQTNPQTAKAAAEEFTLCLNGAMPELAPWKARVIDSDCETNPSACGAKIYARGQSVEPAEGGARLETEVLSHTLHRDNGDGMPLLTDAARRTLHKSKITELEKAAFAKCGADTDCLTKTYRASVPESFESKRVPGLLPMRHVNIDSWSYFESGGASTIWKRRGGESPFPTGILFEIGADGQPTTVYRVPKDKEYEFERDAKPTTLRVRKPGEKEQVHPKETGFSTHPIGVQVFGCAWRSLRKLGINPL